MADIVFYRFTDAGSSSALPVLLEKSLAQGFRTIVRTGDEDSIANLDRLLWTYRDDSFLPHGSAQDGYEDEQPIWLTSAAENPNRADLLVLLDGAAPFALDVFKRCLYLFNGRDAASAEKARSCKADFAGHNIASWRQSAAGWVKDEDQ